MYNIFSILPLLLVRINRSTRGVVVVDVDSGGGTAAADATTAASGGDLDFVKEFETAIRPVYSNTG